MHWVFHGEREPRGDSASHRGSGDSIDDEIIQVDIAGPLAESLGVSQYDVMLVDSASRLQSSYGKASSPLSSLSRMTWAFLACSERTAVRSIHTNRVFVDYSNGL